MLSFIAIVRNAGLRRFERCVKLMRMCLGVCAAHARIGYMTRVMPKSYRTCCRDVLSNLLSGSSFYLPELFGTRIGTSVRALADFDCRLELVRCLEHYHWFLLLLMDERIGSQCQQPLLGAAVSVVARQPVRQYLMMDLQGYFPG